MTRIPSIAVVVALASFSAMVHGHSHAGGHHGHTNAAAPSKETPSQAAAELADGEIRKIDKEAKKITLKHGEIKSLDMPPMTMVFQVKDEKMLDGLKVGDKVKFAAERGKGSYVVTSIQAAK